MRTTNETAEQQGTLGWITFASAFILVGALSDISASANQSDDRSQRQPDPKELQAGGALA